MPKQNNKDCCSSDVLKKRVPAGQSNPFFSKNDTAPLGFNMIGIASTMKEGEIPKRAAAARPSVLYYRGKLGESLTQRFPQFDLWDPNMHLTDWTYNSLHDKHLKIFFSQPDRKRLLIKHGLITHDEKVLCSRKEFSQNMKFIKTVQQSWEKLFVQKQKKLLKDFILHQLRGQVPEHVTVSDMKEWLIHRGRNTFRKMYQRFMKWSDPQCAELAWELTQRFQLEDLEKEVVRELRLQGQDNLEDLSRCRSSVARPVSPIFSSSFYESNSTSTEESSSLLMTMQNLHKFIRRFASRLTEEMKENLVPVLLELLHDECSTPCSSTRSSSAVLPIFTSSEDMTQTDEDSTVISCRDSISPVISSTTSEVSCSSIFNSGSDLGSFSGHRTSSADVMICESKVMSQSCGTDPVKLKRSSGDVCGLNMAAVIPDSGWSADPFSAEITTVLAEDIESPTSRDSSGDVHLLSKAEMVVLEVLNSSVTLMKSLPGSQTEDCCYKDTQNSLRADTDHNIEEILFNLPSPPLSSPSSPTSVTEEEGKSLTESSKSCSILCPLTSSRISVISSDVVQSCLERVISVLEFEGVLGPHHRSEETDDSSSCQSSESDSTSERPRCVSVGPTGSQHDLGSRLIGGHSRKSSTTSLLSETELEAWTSETVEAVVKSVVMDECHTPRPGPCPSSHAVSHLSSEAKRALSKTLVGIQRKCEDGSESLKEIASLQNRDAIVELINEMLRRIQASPSLCSQHQDSPSSLQCASIMSSCTSRKDAKVQAAFEALKSKVITECDRTFCQRPMTCPSFRSLADKSDLRNMLREILLTKSDSTCRHSDKVSEELSSRSLTSSLAGVMYQHLQDKCQSEIQISETLDDYITAKDDCSNKSSSSEVKVISCPPSESVIHLLERTFGNNGKTFNEVESAFKHLTKRTFEKLHFQSQSAYTERTVQKVTVKELCAEGAQHCTVDCSDTPSSATKSEQYSEIVLRVVETTVTRIIMETFRLHRLCPESGGLIHDFESLVSTHPQHEFLMWLHSATMETIMRQLFVPQKVTDVSDVSRAENLTGTLGATGESTAEMDTPVGSKPKKIKRVHTFFRQAWQAVKKTFCIRSNKISPDY